MSKKRATPAAETKPVYTGPLGLHPVSDTAFEVREQGNPHFDFIELFAPDAFADCDMSEAVCQKFDGSPIGNLQPGDAIGFSTPDGKTAIPFLYTASIGWHFDPITGQDTRTVKKITKLYAPTPEDPTPKP